MHLNTFLLSRGGPFSSLSLSAVCVLGILDARRTYYAARRMHGQQQQCPVVRLLVVYIYFSLLGKDPPNRHSHYIVPLHSQNYLKRLFLFSLLCCVFLSLIFFPFSTESCWTGRMEEGPRLFTHRGTRKCWWLSAPITVGKMASANCQQPNALTRILYTGLLLCSTLFFFVYLFVFRDGRKGKLMILISMSLQRGPAKLDGILNGNGTTASSFNHMQIDSIPAVMWNKSTWSA